MLPVCYTLPLNAQVLADFLRLMLHRKEEEVQHVSSQIADLAQDILEVSKPKGACTNMCMLDSA